jgi:hypothetical protein
MTGKAHNVTMASANTEYSFKVPSNTKHLIIKGRSGLADIKMAYDVGKSGTEYITIPATSTKTMVGTERETMSDIILYFQSTITDVVEIETWA